MLTDKYQTTRNSYRMVILFARITIVNNCTQTQWIIVVSRLNLSGHEEQNSLPQPERAC